MFSASEGNVGVSLTAVKQGLRLQEAETQGDGGGATALDLSSDPGPVLDAVSP